MDDLPVPLSAALSTASAAASRPTCKPVAVATPIVRKSQSTDPPASLRIKNEHATTNHSSRKSRDPSVSHECLHNNADDHAHHAAHSSDIERAKKSHDSDCACAASNAATCSHHVCLPLSTGDIFRQLAGCSFYFGRLSASEASRKLSACSVGTFLLRDSSDRRFLFALTVQTHRGPTSVRLARDESGRFRLDCDRSYRTTMPTFASVVDLVRFYFRPAEDRRCILVNNSGTENSIPVTLSAYLTASGNPPTLADLARLCVHHARRRNLERSSTQSSERKHKCVECFVDLLPPYVDEKTKTFLARYPFDL